MIAGFLFLGAVLVAGLAWRLHRLEQVARRRHAEQKAEFLSILSHELRTPLHGWLAVLEMLENTELDEQQRRYVSLLRQSADQLGVVAAGALMQSEDAQEVQATPGNATVPARIPVGCRLLLADDVELNRVVLREFLADTGCLIHMAEDGAEVVRLTEVGGYDMAVLDLRMPVMDGFAAAAAIRERERRLGLKPMPLVALSAGTSFRDRERATEAGFDLFLAKPIDRAALVAALAGLWVSKVPPRAGAPRMPEGLEHMLPLFVTEMEKDAATLQALASGPPDELAEHVHGMRGKCGMFGEEILYELLTRLEAQVKAGNQSDCAGLLAAIIERAAQLREYAADV